MPKLINYIKPELNNVLGRIQTATYSVVGRLNTEAWCTKEPVVFSKRRSGRYRKLSVGDKWGDLFDCAWFRFTGKIPTTAAGKKVVLLIDVNGELCVVDKSGIPLRGLTCVASTFDPVLGNPGKRVLQFSPKAQAGARVDIWADAGSNDLFGNLKGNGTVKGASIAILNEEMRSLYYDYEILLDALKVLPEDSARHQEILCGLSDVSHVLDSYTATEARRARAILEPILTKHGGNASLTISAVGHAHLDLTWLWPMRETFRKGARTYSTVVDLMKRYPDYVFGASQPQLFQWMKDLYPRLYVKIKQLVKQGRFELQGAMWVEADTNVSGGEALIRQILLGKKFFEKEFGADIRYCWLPDVFGYSAALPQILKKSDVDYFITQKLAWNKINKFPHHSFHWQGIDGTKTLAHMLPEGTYNSDAIAHSVSKIEKTYGNKDVSKRCLMLFGIGDGGGGPGAEHLERLKRLKNLSGFCPVQQESAASFLKKWSRDSKRFPTWVGELFLEWHHGTLTTQANNKRYNRKMEQSLRQLEWLSLLSKTLTGLKYPTKQLETVWKEVLLYQFHDILPGSSIKRVYDECIPRYEKLFSEVSNSISKTESGLARHIDTAKMKKPAIIFNNLNWQRTEWVKACGKWTRLTVPPMGYTVVDTAKTSKGITKLTASKTCLENDCIRILFRKDGSITSVYNKKSGREILAKGQRANRLAVYKDTGDAWDFPRDYAEKPARYMELKSSKAKVDGPCAIVEHVYKLGHSQLIQQIVLTSGSDRLDFVTQVHWREIQSMLRTSFPVAVHSESASFEIQFGHIRRPTHRNTTWDIAKDEVPAHKWADISQPDHGVALLNDCKYGYKIRNNIIDLALLRSVIHPGPVLVKDEEVKPGEPHGAYTDQCEHSFTYSLLGHEGDLIQGGVVQAGYELNFPLSVVGTKPRKGSLPQEASFLQIDADGIIVESVKQAEDDNDTIIRLYEAYGQDTKANISFGFPVRSAKETNLMETKPRLLKLNKGQVRLNFTPFEIKTLRLTAK